MVMINESVLMFLFLSGFFQPLSTSDNQYTGDLFTDEVIEAATGVLSFVLFLLSLSAYLVTKVKKLIFAVGAFGLFTLHAFIDFLEDAVQAFDTIFVDSILSTIMLAILILFFLAIIKSK
jgi:hypothetical protein